ncbi:hypothetical protein COT97_00790 [Candidatus Falkowbacteria bacterium CG10_big_fil_rev_8_21_14_0_10_39_11]|uniref:Uncharacterized protein n=1 Tax=Candidatus Falkowbacteria bacterium CG10_big_fil_rev_8_21_14_0_10_39_11 TaxID=1974565 RepID=A0A2H0V672_9BACT|nr:MAG: hypothetical protein COT97_00790 [Candidatus Falkowbacteria bacterium CG10_big_fil_rev_8_21_14_0_10_39_11]
MTQQIHSLCCNVKLEFSLADGVQVGSCSKCHKNVARINLKTGQEEWLDGNSPWTNKTLSPVVRN